MEAIAVDDGQTDEYPDVLAPVEIHGEQLAYLIFTSGSTGRPKAVMVSHANLINYLDGITGALGLTPADRVLNFASISFDATTEEIYPALLTGASVLPRPSELRVPDAAFDALLATFHPTVLSLPVSFWHAWVDQLGTRNAVAGSWVARRPARSAESSALRDHSRRAATMARTPRAPPGTAFQTPVSWSRRCSRVW